MPATATAEDILAPQPDGVFLSNGPGDPAATGDYAVPEIKKLLDSGMPVFGICLGHQMLALALGGRTEKMPFGHHGANHPVKDLTTGKVEITCQNHGFAVADDAARRTSRSPTARCSTAPTRASAQGQAGLLGAVPSRGLARPDRLQLPVRPLRGDRS